MKEDAFNTLLDIARSCAPDNLVCALELSEKGFEDPALRIGVFGTSPTTTRKALLGLLGPILRCSDDGILISLKQRSMVDDVWRNPLVVGRGESEAFFCCGDVEMVVDGDVAGRLPLDLGTPAGTAEIPAEAADCDNGKDDGNSYAKLLVDADDLDGVRLLVANPISVDFTALGLLPDIVYPVLSATALLSREDRQLLEGLDEMRPNESRTVLLADTQVLDSDDLAEVQKELEVALPGAEVVYLEDAVRVTELWADWHTAKTECKDKRQERSVDYALPILRTSVHERISSAEDEGKQHERLLDRLADVEKGMRRHAEATSRLTDRHEIERMTLKAQQAIIVFEDEMSDDLRLGIEEEPDTAALADALPYFIQGEWKRFWTSKLLPMLEAEAESAESMIEADIADRVGRELQRQLDEGEIAEIESLVKSMGGIELRYPMPTITPQGPYQEPWSGVDDGTERPAKELADIVAAALGIAGGVALIAGWGIAPAGLLVVAGWQLRGIAGGRNREDLLEDALAMSTYMRAQSEECVVNLMADCRAQVVEAIENSYKSVFEALEMMIETATSRNEEQRARIEELEKMRRSLEEWGQEGLKE